MPSLQVVYTTFSSACTELMASKLEPVHFTNPFDASSVENKWQLPSATRNTLQIIMNHDSGS